MRGAHTANRPWLHGGMLGLLLAWTLGHVFVQGVRPLADAYTAVSVRPGIQYTSFDVTARGYAGSGRAYIARIELDAPGLSLFVTPPDAQTDHTAWYRLRYPWQVAWQHDLDVVVNGALFRPPPAGYWPFAWAQGYHTTISEGTVSHLNPASYLLWLTQDHTPALTAVRPAPAEVRARAQWGVGGLVRELRDGAVHARIQNGGTADRYTMMAACPATRRLWLAAFDHVTRGTAARILADQGAADGLILDGGGSTAFFLHPRTTGVPGGLHIGGQRPVATHIGVRVRRPE